MPNPPSRIVHSTDDNTQRRLDAQKKAPAKPPWLTGPPQPPEKQVISIRREVKGRGGKTATVIYGFQVGEATFKDLAKQLREACGTGGSAKDGEIIIQGDHREKVAAYLQGMGYKTKFTGG